MTVVGYRERPRQGILVADKFHSRDRDRDGLAGRDGDGGLLPATAGGVEHSPSPLVRGSVTPTEDEGNCGEENANLCQKVVGKRRC